MTSWLNWIAINHIVLPLIFLFLGLLFIVVIAALEKKLPENSRLRIWLNGQHRWKNPYWLRDRIDMIFTVLIVFLLIAVTIIFS